MHHGGIRAGLQQLAHHDVAVALGVVVLEAKQRHYATIQELANVGQRVGGGRAVQHLAVAGAGLGFAGAEPGPVFLGITQRAMVHVADADGREGLGQLRLRQTWLSAQRGQANIDEDSYVLCEQLRNKIADSPAFVADADQGALGGISCSHESLWCITSRAKERRTPDDATQP